MTSPVIAIVIGLIAIVGANVLGYALGRRDQRSRADREPL